MQTSLLSPIPFSLNKHTIHKQHGFTLVELLISVAIVGILTAMVTVKYKAFDSTTLLKGAAYEIALTLREAQIKSLSAVRDNTGALNFDYPYGVHFADGSKVYNAFIFKDTVSTNLPNYDILNPTPFATTLATSTLDRTIQVSDVCVYNSASITDCGVSDVDISFRRPEFKAIFYVPGYSPLQNAGITKATIEVQSSNNPANAFLIEVSQLGQISVYKKP